MRCIESHISTLTEMGEKSKERTSSDFRYGEVEEELYSDIACDGGLSFTAKILNASDHRKEFRAADFAAQVGNGAVAGSRRQRVTMRTPDEFMMIAGAVREGVEVDREISIAEVEGEASQRIRGRSYRKKTAKGGKHSTRTEREHERKRRAKTEATTITEEVTPVSPVSPVPPVLIRETVTNEVPEEVSLRVESLDYKADSRQGMLILEIERGSFKKANKYIRKNFVTLIRKQASPEAAAKIPANAPLEIESISITADDLCEVKFKVKERKQ